MTARARVLDVAAAVAGLATDLTASLLGWLLEGRRTGGPPAPGDGHQAPVPGTGTGHPGGQRNPPPARPSPAPGLTPDETTLLGYLQRARGHRPGAASAGQVIADGLRERCPHLDDLTLGVIVTELHGYVLAAAIGLPDQRAALATVTDCLGLAAEDLTRLHRLDGAPFDARD